MPILEAIQDTIFDTIHKCLCQAVEDDFQEAQAHLNLETSVSAPFLKWDLIYRNLKLSFSESNILWSAKKRGMWEIALLYDKTSRMLISFMRDTRFNVIRQAKKHNQPQYIRSLITLNRNLQALQSQQGLFDEEDEITENQEELISLLNSLCKNFTEPVSGRIEHHVLIVFSSNYGQISSLKAYVLDKNLDTVEVKDCLSITKPIMSNIIEQTTKQDETTAKPKLTIKAKKRLEEKQLVSLKKNQTNENQV